MDRTMNALDFMIELANAAAADSAKYMQAGHNGPYHHPETLVRNRGHWLFTFARLYADTGDERFKVAAEPLAAYLLSKEARPYGASFYHRNQEGKDKANGLVGQAWTIESLVEAARLFNDNSFTALAAEVFNQHHFLPRYGLWNILEINGVHKPIDYAFNHQLWFAAAGSLLHDEKIQDSVQLFLNKLFDNLTLLDSGLIYHELEHEYQDPYQYKAGTKQILKNKALAVLETVGLRKQPAKQYASLEEKKRVKWDKMKHKSIGYHAFNTYAFAILKAALPEHPIWKKPEFMKIPAYLLTEEYAKGVEDNQYSFAYNPPGFEIPYSLLLLSDMEEQALLETSGRWLQQQISKTYDKHTQQFSLQTEDAVTLTARIYELSRLPAGLLEKIRIKI
jgi:hypothetical protein